MSHMDLDGTSEIVNSRDDIRRALMAAPSTPSEAVNQWLADHPIKLASEVIGDVTKSVVAPIAQRSPVLFVASALAVGAVLVWSRPWTWLLKPAILAGVVPQVISKVLAYSPKRS
jgi:hypothetical protein